MEAAKIYTYKLSTKALRRQLQISPKEVETTVYHYYFEALWNRKIRFYQTQGGFRNTTKKLQNGCSFQLT